MKDEMSRQIYIPFQKPVLSKGFPAEEFHVQESRALVLITESNLSYLPDFRVHEHEHLSAIEHLFFEVLNRAYPFTQYL